MNAIVRRRRRETELTEWRLRCSVAVAEAELLTATAGTGIIGTPLRVLGGNHCHHLGARAPALHQLAHHPHHGLSVGEEQIQSGAEVVLSRIAIAGLGESILRTSPVTQRLYFTALALRRERVALVIAELALLGRGNKLHQVSLMDIAQLVAGLDEVIARINIAVVLESRAISAGRSVNAEQMPAKIGLERHIEHLYKDRAHVVAHPLLENIHEELTILFAADGAFGDEVSGLSVEQAFAAWLFAPALVGDINCFRRGAFDDGNKLYPFRFHLVAKKTVNGAAVFLVCGIDGAQDVELDSVLAQKPPALHHFVEGALLASVDAVGVVDLAWAVHAQPDQKIVLLEERAPFIIQKNAVGLKGVFHGLLGPTVFFDEFDGTPEELDFHQCRLATLPRHRNCWRAVRLQQLADVGLERGIGHPALFVGIQRLF